MRQALVSLLIPTSTSGQPHGSVHQHLLSLPAGWHHKSQPSSILGMPWAACPGPMALPRGTWGCSFSHCCQASHSLAGAPQLLLPEGGCDGCAHNKAPAETIAQECIRFLTNTVWARTIALDSHPKNTFHGARVRVACLPQPAHIPVYAKELEEAWPLPHPDLYPESGPRWSFTQPFFLRTAQKVSLFSQRAFLSKGLLSFFFF